MSCKMLKGLCIKPSWWKEKNGWWY